MFENNERLRATVSAVGDGVRLAIIEDHELMLETLGAALRSHELFESVVTASSVTQFRSMVETLEVDAVLTDFALGDGSGSQVAELTHQRLSVPVLLMTGQGDTDGVTAAITSGCAGFVSKSAPLTTLVTAIATVVAGGTVFPASLLQEALSQPTVEPTTPVTERERSVLEGLAQGKNATEIGEELFVSIHTVRNHIRSLLTKLHARSQLEAVVIAVRSGLVDIR